MMPSSMLASSAYWVVTGAPVRHEGANEEAHVTHGVPTAETDELGRGYRGPPEAPNEHPRES